MHGHGGLPERLRGILADRPLIVVSNREPYTHRRSAGGAKVERPVGGLTAALDPMMQDLSGTWIAWADGDADFDDDAAGGSVPVPPEAPRYTLKRIALPRHEVEGYYYGYANQALWPLCHMAMGQARFRPRYWAAYQSVNARFAAVQWVLTRALGDDWAATASVVYLGDDRTDEDAFEALAAPAVTVKVGPNAHPTAARYAVRNIDEVYRFIETIDARRAASPVLAGAAAGGASG